MSPQQKSNRPGRAAAWWPVLTVLGVVLVAVAGWHWLLRPEDAVQVRRQGGSGKSSAAAKGPVSVRSEPITGEPLAWVTADGRDMVTEPVGDAGALLDSGEVTGGADGGSRGQDRIADQPAALLTGASGLEMTAGQRKMLALLNEVRRRTRDDNRFLQDRTARRLRAMVAHEPAGASAVARCGVYYNLGMAEQKLGREQEAIEAFTKAYELLPQVQAEMGTLPSQTADELAFRMGVAYMRLGETQNCCQQHTPESCILPIRGGGIHTRQEGSRRAIAFFMEVLRRTPQDSPMHLKSRWLLNIAYMTVGGYPQEVPTEYLIPSQAFESDEPFPRFSNVAKEAGLGTFSVAGGAIADDFDNDGWIDLVVSPLDPAEQIRFFQNNQDGTFTDRTNEAGLKGLCGGLNLVQADYDNDGDVDLLVLRGAWLGAAGRHPKSLLRNEGGRFVDVTFEAGLAEVSYPTQTASWADYDNDGDLDLYVGGESSEQGNVVGGVQMPGLLAPCQLFRNNGDGTFRDLAAQAGVENLRFAKGVVWGDYDGDGYADLYVSNLGEPNRLYRNARNGTFRDVAPELGVTGPRNCFPAWFWDFDNDGALDIFVCSYEGGQDRVADVAAGYLGLATNVEPSCLYRGDGKGGFTEVGRQYNLRRVILAMGANFGDLDNDGWPDFYLGTGYPDYEALMPNVMYRNRAGRSFADVTTAGGFGHLQKGHAVAFADFDNDGDQDVFEQMGGNYPGDRCHDALYQNPGFGNHWITVKLIGVESNRAGVGARIRVDVIEDGRPRTIYKHVNSGGSFGANPLRQMIGLGKATRIERVEILWPATRRTQSSTEVPLDQAIEIVEGQGRVALKEL